MKNNEIQDIVQDIEDSVLKLFKLYRGYKNLHLSICIGSKILSKLWGSKKMLAVHCLPDTLELHDSTIYYMQHGNIHSVPLTDEVLNLEPDYMFNLYLLLDIKIFRSIVFCILEIKFFKFEQNRIYYIDHINEYIESKVNI